MQQERMLLFYPYWRLLLRLAHFYFTHERKIQVPKKDDREKFASTVEHFNILEEMALEAMRLRDTTTQETFLVEPEGDGAY